MSAADATPQHPIVVSNQIAGRNIWRMPNLPCGWLAAEKRFRFGWAIGWML
jgi:hypothetical protein